MQFEQKQMKQGKPIRISFWYIKEMKEEIKREE
jgi:hypothetical protein